MVVVVAGQVVARLAEVTAGGVVIAIVVVVVIVGGIETRHTLGRPQTGSGSGVVVPSQHLAHLAGGVQPKCARQLFAHDAVVDDQRQDGVEFFLEALSEEDRRISIVFSFADVLGRCSLTLIL